MAALPNYTALIFGLIGTAMLQPYAMQVARDWSQGDAEWDVGKGLGKGAYL